MPTEGPWASRTHLEQVDERLAAVESTRNRLLGVIDEAFVDQFDPDHYRQVVHRTLRLAGGSELADAMLTLHHAAVADRAELHRRIDRLEQATSDTPELDGLEQAVASRQTTQDDLCAALDGLEALVGRLTVHRGSERRAG